MIKLEDYTVLELKKLLKDRGFMVSGRKSALIMRLRGTKQGRNSARRTPKRNGKSLRKRSVSKTSAKIGTKKSLTESSVTVLKNLLRQNGLPLYGTKADNIERLWEFKTGKSSSKKTSGRKTSGRLSSFSKLTVEQLKDLLRKKGLAVSGKKAELIARLSGTSKSGSKSVYVFKPVKFTTSGDDIEAMVIDPSYEKGLFKTRVPKSFHPSNYPKGYYSKWTAVQMFGIHFKNLEWYPKGEKF